MADPKRVIIIAGEASGDHHAARLVEELHRLNPDVRFSGIGGERMRAAGVETLVDTSEMAVMGLVEVLVNYRFLKGVLERMRSELRRNRPDLLILVDYPGFNLRLAETAKELGIRVLYYISPQVWAWKKKRVFKIKKLVDMMAVVFPFEISCYDKAGVPVEFVGHPLVDEVQSHYSREVILAELGLDPSRPVLGLFPGSRRSEVSRLLPLLLQSAARLKEAIPELQFLLPRASTLHAELLQQPIARSGLEITVVSGRPYDVMRGCDTIISASGTATLEIGLMQVPLVVIYKLAPVSYFVFSRLVKLDHIALCNIVAGERIAPELIQRDATVANICREVLPLLQDEQRAAAMRARMAGIRKRLGASGASKNIARLTLNMLEESA
ncbi:MAG: lipid-A-disaccharide synthase [Gammaproteobacteria bacterium]|nr:lipid-A-disaccharide synthase [Gammaproteobacteria bacterium]